MSTVASRHFTSIPARDAMATWRAIVDLLVGAKSADSKTELLAVSGIAASLITDRAPEKAAIVVTCDGPRTRIYCLYDENAVEGTDVNETALGYDGLKGEWHVSLPCPATDLAWVQRALKGHGSRISARDAAEQLGPAQAAVAKSEGSLTLDVEAFLKP